MDERILTRYLDVGDGFLPARYAAGTEAGADHAESTDDCSADSGSLRGDLPGARRSSAAHPARRHAAGQSRGLRVQWQGAGG